MTTQFNLRELAGEQEKGKELGDLLSRDSHGLKLQQLPWGQEQVKAYCELSMDSIRPYIPKVLRERFFGLFHLVSHPGARSSDHLILRHHVPPMMNRGISVWCKHSLDCQMSKITRLNKIMPSPFVAADERFEHIHIDIGVMPNDGGYRFFFTIVDRFTS